MMFQSFFEAPEIAAIFSRKLTNKETKKAAEKNCVEHSTLRLCKQSKKREKIIKRTNKRTFHQQNRPITKSQKYKTRMEDASKIAMLNEENVYYDYDDETGVIIEKKHSVVSNYNTALKVNIKDGRKSELSSLLEESLHELTRDLKAETLIDGSCPSDSAYDTTHDEITDSIERLALPNDNINGVHELYFEEERQPSSSPKQVSPYKRCRSSAVCGRNCRLCGGSNRNVVNKTESKETILETRDRTCSKSASEISDENNFQLHESDSRYSSVIKTIGSFQDRFLDMSKNSPKEYQIAWGQENQNMHGIFNEKGKENKPKVGDNVLSQGFVPNGYIIDDNNEKITFPDLYAQERENEEFFSGPHLMMLYDFKAEHEDDVSVMKGEVVLLLDNHDRDWVWIMKENCEEGFVPRSLTVEYSDCEECEKEEQLEKPTSKASTSVAPSEHERETAFLRSGIKMIAITNFEATGKNKLSVNKGEEIIISFKDQVVPGWLWAYSPRKKTFGFVPERLIQALEVSVV